MNMMTIKEVEQELHTAVLDSMIYLSGKAKNNEFDEYDLSNFDDMLRSLIVEKIMERFFRRGPSDGIRGIDTVEP